MISLQELADYLGADFEGDGSIAISGIAPLGSASSGQLSFIAKQKYAAELPSCQASALLISPELAEDSSYTGQLLVVADPYLAYAKASRLFDPFITRARADVHPRASVHEQAQLGENVEIGANAVIEADAVIADNCRIGAGCFVGHGARLGVGTILHANVCVYHGVTLGENCIVHSGTAIGSDGFGFAPTEQGWVKIHQIGGVTVGDCVEIGSNTSIDRGALDDTVIADGVIIDNLVHIAHNVKIGRNTAIAGCCGFAGSTTVGENCSFAGQVGVTGHIDICDNAHFLGKAMVTNSVTQPGVYSSGVPLSDVKTWRKNAARFRQLDQLARRVADLAKRIGS